MKRPLCFICFLFVAAVALYLKLIPSPQFEAGSYEGTWVYLTGTVDRIEYRNGKNQLYLKHVLCDSSHSGLDSEFRRFKEISCICYLKEAEPIMTEGKVTAGCRVMVRGKLCTFSKATNPGEFDLRAYYAVQNIYFSLQQAEICGGGNDYDRLTGVLYKIRLAGINVFDRYLPDADAGILRAMLLGDRTALEKTDKTLFEKSGISHILAISGLHISLLGMGLYGLLGKLRMPYVPAMLLAVLFMFLYGKMTGMSSSSGRAILMFAIRLNAKRVGRTYDMLTALAVAALLLVMEQPLYVTYAGFQLSFGAIIGLGCLLPALEQVFGKYRCIAHGNKNGEMSGIAHGNMSGKMVDRIVGKLQSAIYGNVSVMLVTLPVMLYHYYEYSVYSIFLNLAVLPTVGILIGAAVALLCGGEIIALLCGQKIALLCGEKMTLLCSGRITSLCSGIMISLHGGSKTGEVFQGMPLSIGTGAVSMLLRVAQDIEHFLAYICMGMLWLYRNGSKLLLRLPGAVQIIGKPQLWQIVLYIMGLLLFMALSWYIQWQQRNGRTIRKRRKIAAIGLLLLVTALLCLTQNRETRGLEITFLDVGQGDGICVQEQKGHGILIDCGSSNRKNIGQKVLTPFLKSRGIHTLDAVFLSHLDSDHVNGVLQILEDRDGIEIKRIILSAYIPQDEAWCRLLETAALNGVTISYMKEAEIYGNEDLQFICISPGAGATNTTVYEKTAGGSMGVNVSGSEGASADRNGSSMMLLMKYGDFQAVFTGDADAGEEEQALEVLKKIRWKISGNGAGCTLLKVSHHGSKTASGELFIEALQPEIAVISCSNDNSYGHPHKEVLERLDVNGATCFCTKDIGAVIVSVTENGKSIVQGYAEP